MRKVLINVEERELRVAILDDDQLVELYIESLDEKSILNNIYKGRIQDVLPGLKAAFVNIGLDRNAFLHFDDVRPDLIWGKYREMNPELADEVPTAREALAVDAEEPEVEGDVESEDKRKRRRGRRGGKKRRPDAEDSYSPGLPVGVTEDDLEDDEEEDSETSPIAARAAQVVEQSDAVETVPQKFEYVRPPSPPPQPYTGMPAPYTGMPAQPYNATPASAPAPVSNPPAAAQAPPVSSYPAAQEGQPDPSGLSAEELEQRKQARMEKQKQRRDRWEQKKLERQQRRQQERTDRIQQPRAETTAPEAQAQPEPPQPAAVYGTRGAPSAYDAYTPFNTGNQRRQHVQRDRFGDAIGNVAVGTVRRNDHRDSQSDFFGPMSTTQDEQHSIWDDKQPNLGPIPGAGKAFLPEFETPSRGSDRRSSFRRPMGNNQNRPRRFGNNSNTGNVSNSDNAGNTGNSNNKRRGGKKRTMRKRDTRSYFAFSADDLLDNEQLVNDTPAAETDAPKKPVRKRKSAAEVDGEAPVKKAAARKPAAKKDPAVPKTTTRKKKPNAVASADDAQALAPELPLDIPAPDASASADAAKSEPKKAARKTAGTTTRARKTKAKADAPPDNIDAPVPEQLPELPVAEPASSAETAPISEGKVQEQQTVESRTEPQAAEQSAPAPEATQDVKPESHAPVTQSEQATSQPSVSGESASETTGQISSPPAVGSEEQQPGAAAGPEDGRERSRRRNSRPTRAERAARQREKRAAAQAEVAPEQTPGAVTDESKGAVTAGGSTEAPAVSQPTSQTPYPAPAVRPNAYAGGNEKSRHPNKRQDARKLRRPQFQDVFKKGDEIMVQVVKEEIGMKGARISSYVSLPGRYLVLLPYPNQEGGISRKVEDIRERKRLKTLLRDISTDETAFIIRTAGVFQEEKEIRDDVEFLNDEWGTIANKYSTVEATGLVYDDHDILYRLARDVFDDSVAEIQIDSHMEHEKLKRILGKLIPGLVEKTKLYSGAENIFQKFGVTKQIQKAARRKVWLKSGGYLIIDEAEALTAIDVNTGKSVGKDDQEKLILRTNLESAKAVARELKLRDIGGLIVIDFIDMKDFRNKEQVLHELKLQLRKDRSKTSVSAISEFGLVEMTRKRVRRSLRKTLFMDCPYCQGAGVVLNEQQIWLHIKHEMVRQLESGKQAALLSITVNSRIRAYIDQNYRDVIRRLEQKYDTEIRVTMSDIFHMENYQIEKAETGVISGSATMPTM